MIINTAKEKVENFILSKPNAIASKLHEFGLRKDIKSIEIDRRLSPFSHFFER